MASLAPDGIATGALARRDCLDCVLQVTGVGVTATDLPRLPSPFVQSKRPKPNKNSNSGLDPVHELTEYEYEYE